MLEQHPDAVGLGIREVVELRGGEALDLLEGGHPGVGHHAQQLPDEGGEAWQGLHQEGTIELEFSVHAPSLHSIPKRP